MNNLLNFEHVEFGEITIISEDGELWFVGKEIATKLGYSDTDQAIRNHVDEDDKKPVKLTGYEKGRKIIIISESGLYGLILNSQLKSSKKFKQWVTKEVLPSIRKHGFYIQEGMEKNAYEHIQKLHADDKNVFKVLRDIVKYASDYNKNKDSVKWLFASIRNEIYKVTTGYVASDIIYYRANHEKELMGLTTFTGKTGPTKKDVKNAKLYLDKNELKKVVKATNLSIEFAETTMLLNDEYTINDFILQWNTIMKGLNKGEEVDTEAKHSRKEADEYAVKELDKYRELLVSNKAISC